MLIFFGQICVLSVFICFFFYDEKEMGNYYENYVALRWEIRKLGHVALKQKTQDTNLKKTQAAAAPAFNATLQINYNMQPRLSSGQGAFIMLKTTTITATSCQRGNRTRHSGTRLGKL